MKQRHFFASKKSAGKRLLHRSLLCMLAFSAIGLFVYGLGKANQTDFAKMIDEGQLVRLHIIANSDSDADQSIKLSVRDAVLQELSPLLDGATSQAQAEEIIKSSLGSVEKLAQKTASELGFGGGAGASFGVYHFPDKSYAGHFVPEGDYKALRITLGEAKGQNWWCVMYPPLCFVGEECVGLDDVHFESAIANWLKELFAEKKEDET